MIVCECELYVLEQFQGTCIIGLVHMFIDWFVFLVINKIGVNF